ncbi:hypothetical protein RF11_07807 [Thelohanellus kitauei]|uniref:BHLH domain-containing protein n=1 Tax=Thelohanellus kitauei TaxID=669202 RepID=A0A0C2N0J6_THEKT|nr:hypothetical protein RF11_07807 [Thelohanellus kitauei]
MPRTRATIVPTLLINVRLIAMGYVQYLTKNMSKRSSCRKENHNLIERRYRSQISRCFAQLEEATFSSGVNDVGYFIDCKSGTHTKSHILKSAAEKIQALQSENDKLQRDNKSLRDKIKSLTGSSCSLPDGANKCATKNENLPCNNGPTFVKPNSSSMNILGLTICLYFLCHTASSINAYSGANKHIYTNYIPTLPLFTCCCILWFYLCDMSGSLLTNLMDSLCSPFPILNSSCKTFICSFKDTIYQLFNLGYSDTLREDHLYKKIEEKHERLMETTFKKRANLQVIKHPKKCGTGSLKPGYFVSNDNYSKQLVNSQKDENYGVLYSVFDGVTQPSSKFIQFHALFGCPTTVIIEKCIDQVHFIIKIKRKEDGEVLSIVVFDNMKIWESLQPNVIRQMIISNLFGLDCFIFQNIALSNLKRNVDMHSYSAKKLLTTEEFGQITDQLNDHCSKNIDKKNSFFAFTVRYKIEKRLASNKTFSNQELAIGKDNKPSCVQHHRAQVAYTFVLLRLLKKYNEMIGLYFRALLFVTIYYDIGKLTISDIKELRAQRHFANQA